VLMIEMLFLISLIPTWNNKAYAHISQAIPNAILKKKMVIILHSYPILLNQK
jgi:hypothetical protein